MKLAELQETGHGFLVFNPNNEIIIKAYYDDEVDEVRMEDSYDHLASLSDKTRIRFLRWVYGYDEMTAREHLREQGVDDDEIEAWLDAEIQFDNCYNI